MLIKSDYARTAFYKGGKGNSALWLIKLLYLTCRITDYQFRFGLHEPSMSRYRVRESKLNQLLLGLGLDGAL